MEAETQTNSNLYTEILFRKNINIYGDTIYIYGDTKMHLGALCVANAQTLRLQLYSWTNCNLTDHLQLDPTKLQLGANQLQLCINQLQPRD
jgi:hypothetical protein